MNFFTLTLPHVDFISDESQHYAYLAWVPEAEEDLHHWILFRCTTCRIVRRACQFFGHLKDNACEWETNYTFYDKPVCSKCTISSDEWDFTDLYRIDFLVPSFNLVQTFTDRNNNFLKIFFDSEESIDLFFSPFEAEKCLHNDAFACNFLATVKWHELRRKNGAPLFFPVCFESRVENKCLRYYYVSGALSPKCL